MKVLSLLLAAMFVAGCAMTPGHAFSLQASNQQLYTLSNPIDPLQQEPWGYRSQWDQPWRAYTETVPGSTLTSALGINFNVSPKNADAVAGLLQQNGFTRARVEVSWSSMSYSSPAQFNLSDQQAMDVKLEALKAHGIRPLILLNADDHGPVPMRKFTGKITAPITAGSTTAQVDSTTARLLVPSFSGFDNPKTGVVAQVLVTSVVPNGQGATVHLSQPLPKDIPAGSYAVTTLRYQPFAAPFTATGAPNPLFQQTMSGWMTYVQAVTKEATRVLGNDRFDVEVWNELFSGGSDFLAARAYYNPVPAQFLGTGKDIDQILAQTVAWIRSPGSGLPDVGIGDGFANQSPVRSAATSPIGLTALDKHPYPPSLDFVTGKPVTLWDMPQQQPLNALGQPEGTAVKDSKGETIYLGGFTPTYQAFFPEWSLTSLQSEDLERDLSPVTTAINGTPHGRSVTPPGSTTPLQEWITEDNMNMADPLLAGATVAERYHMQAKAALRSLTSNVSLGVTAEYFYAVSNCTTSGGCWSMVNPTAPDGGETMQALQRLMGAMKSAGSLTTHRSLTLNSISSTTNDYQFAGDGTAAHPPLYNRDVTTFFPFQTANNQFVVSTYVMTRNMSKVYSSSATGPARYDLPQSTYQFKIGGIDGRMLKAWATDPDTGSSVPVRIVSRSSTGAVVAMPLTDSPRLLTLQD